jgi:hypothetical protein
VAASTQVRAPASHGISVLLDRMIVSSQGGLTAIGCNQVRTGLLIDGATVKRAGPERELEVAYKTFAMDVRTGSLHCPEAAIRLGTKRELVSVVPT